MVSDCDHPSATDCHVSIIYTFLIPCCDVRYDFHVKQCSVHLYSHLFCMSFVYYYVICYLLMYTGVQQDIHITWCSCRDFTRGILGLVFSIISFLCSVLYINLFVLFLLAIVFSFFPLRFTASDYPFGIFKVFVTVTRVVSLMEQELHILRST